jgi:hypothetical protein
MKTTLHNLPVAPQRPTENRTVSLKSITYNSSNLIPLDNTIVLHMFPRGDKQRAAWTKFIRRHRPGWNPTTSSALCSAHFQGNDFTQRLDIDIHTNRA